MGRAKGEQILMPDSLTVHSSISFRPQYPHELSRPAPDYQIGAHCVRECTKRGVAKSVVRSKVGLAFASCFPIVISPSDLVALSALQENRVTTQLTQSVLGNPFRTLPKGAWSLAFLLDALPFRLR